jgi:hypothetical protein
MKFKKFLELNLPEQQKKILLTVPHATLNESFNALTPFDIRAKDVANILYKEMIKTYPDTELFLANSPRRIADLNRREAFGMQWRQDIQYKILNYIEQGYKVINYDIHSFCNELAGIEYPEWKDKSLAVLALSGMASLLDKIQEVNKNTISFPPFTRDDIIKVATKAGAYCALLEFNESKEILKDEEILSICQKIVEFTNEI